MNTLVTPAPDTSQTEEAPVTVITGTRRGIGQALARHFCDKGHIVVGCSRQPYDLAQVNYRHFVADVADEPVVTKMFGAIRKDFGRVDNLVNNAGIASMNHAMLTPLSSVRSVLDTNVVGTFLFCREAARLMRRSKRGRIVNFSTVAEPLKLEGEAVYAASKAAVSMLTAILAREFADLGITVNCVGPTPIDTDLTRAIPRDKLQALVERQSIKRLGTFEDVINVVDFFLFEIIQVIAQTGLYAGLPAATNALLLVEEVFKEKGINPSQHR